MAKVITDEQNYQNIADAIRAKLGSADTYTPSEMAAAIGAISGGGADSPLDPEVVYLSTRPADWLKMPTAQTSEAYFLIHTPATSPDGVLASMSFSGRNGDSVTAEYGTSGPDGVFVPDSSMSQTWNITTFSQTIDVGRVIPANAFGSLTSDGFKQIIMKISWTAPSNNASLNGNSRTNSGLASSTVEVAMDVSGLNACFLGNGSQGSYATPWAMRYAKLTGTPVGYSPRFQSLFSGCYKLLCVRSLFDLSNIQNISYFFLECHNLISLPAISTSAVTNASHMFQNCESLRAIPSIKLPNVTDFSYFFQYCSGLANADGLVCSPTNMYYAFYGCRSLSYIPTGIDYSHVTNLDSAFSTTGIQGAVSLSLPAATSCYSTFSNSPLISEVTLTDMGSVTNLSQTFTSCTSLRRANISGTSACTNFNNIFYGCVSLEQLPALDTRACTNASQMFYGVPLHRFDLSQYDFKQITSTSGLSAIVTMFGQNIVIIGDTFGSNGITNTGQVVSFAGNFYNTTVDIKIAKTDAMLQLAANATTVLASNSSVVVYVPDDLLSTYQADTYWSTLGARLKGYSEWPY